MLEIYSNVVSRLMGTDPVPALDLDFLAMGGVLDSRVTFARTTDATMFDSTGNADICT